MVYGLARVAAGGLSAAAPARPVPALPERVQGEGLMLAGILALGAALRGIDLNDGLWFDEILTLVRYVRRPLGEIVTRFDSQNQHTLYSVCAHVAVRVFGEHAWSLRLPAALFGVLSIWAVWWLGVRIGSRREALVAAGLLAVSSHHVWFSQDARGYTMLMFFAIVGTGLFLELLERPARSSAVWYVVVMALACWTQVAGAFVVVGHGAVWLYEAVRRSAFGGDSGAGLSAVRRTPHAARTPFFAMIGAGLLTILLYAPVLGAMTHTLAGPKATGGAPQWKSLGWFVGETARGLARGVPGGWITLAVAVVVVAVGLWSYWRASRAATLLLVMPGLVTAVVMLVTAHNLWPRLFFFALGFAALIAVRGGFALCRMAFRARGELVATAGAALAGALSLIMVSRVWAPKQDFGAALDWVAQANTKGEPVLTVDMTQLPYRDYYHTAFIAVDSVAQIGAAQRALGHAWVLVTFPERLQAVDTATWNLLQCCYQEMRHFRGTVEGGAILVMRNP